MALFLRGNVWWYEIKRPTMRIVKSTGFRKPDKAKAEAVYQAALLGAKVRPQRSIIEGMLDAIYSTARERLRIEAMWPLYESWFNGKGKQVDIRTWARRRNRFQALVDWCSASRLPFAEDVSVEMARRYVATLEGANKTIRVKVMDLSCVWSACAQMSPGLHNPWPAACPADDGSGERRDVFTREQMARVLETAEEVGHDWYGICLAARWIGQRYGDCATLEWGRLEWAKAQPVLDHGVVDMDERVIVLDPKKTRRHATRIYIPIADELAEFLEQRRKDDGFLFPEHAVRYLGRDMMSPSFATVLALAGVTDGYFDFHSWRHTFRSMLGDAGVDDATANRFGGWTAPKMGAHYDHAKHLVEMADALRRIK